MMIRLLSNPQVAAVTVSIFAFLVYLRTLAPTVAVIDSGELAAVACLLGVAHPTGYPLFTLLGWVFSKLPIATEEIVRLNIMAAFFCSVAVFFFFHLFRFVLGSLQRQPGTKGRSHRAETDSAAVLAASAGASLLLAFSETYWAMALSVEVYSLHVLFLALIMLTFFKACLFRMNEPEAGKWWMAFAFLLGLSFTNHMTTILLAPGFLYLYFATQGGGRGAWKRIAWMGLPFLAGLSLYLYLPLRAVQQPVLNWGYTVNWERFLWHVTGKQYRVWIFSSTEAAGRQLNYFFDSLPAEVAFIGLILGTVGVVTLWMSHRKLALTSILLFVSCVLYSINYDIHDIDSYFLLAYCCIALWSASGLYTFIDWIARSLKARAGMALTAAVLAGLVPLMYNYTRVDESENHLVEDYTRNMFASMEENALVFSFQWDYWLSASYYYQFVKGVRPDLAVVDKELLRRSWYFKELEQRYTWLIDESRQEVDAFLQELHKFEQDIPYNPQVIQGKFVGMITAMLRRSMETRPVYVTPEIEPEFTQGMYRVPQGLAFRLMPDSSFHHTDPVEYFYRPFIRQGRLEDMFPRLYGSSLTARGAYFLRFGHVSTAREAFEKALIYDPASSEARRWLQILPSLEK